MKRAAFTESAFRHGYVEADFYEVLLEGPLKIRSQRGLDNVYELLGQNLAGDYLHIIYRTLPNGQFRVFHINRMTTPQRRRYQRIRS